jgi:hypothetical protein
MILSTQIELTNLLRGSDAPIFNIGENQMSTKMNVKEFICTLHMPNKLEQIIVNGEERPHSLPPGNAREAHPVDSYPACPDSWMNGSDIASSYFVGVEEDKGMWMDFNDCHFLDRDVAVVISVQGINPITGQKTDTLRLEQYKEKCPIHDVSFQQDNYCPKCKFDWPDQNYLATTGTNHPYFWLDGFRRPDGTVRQYIFTSEELKGVASQLIGKDKVYAIGIAFYYSKEKKPVRQKPISSRSVCMDFDNDFIHKYTPHTYGPTSIDWDSTNVPDMIIGGDTSWQTDLDFQSETLSGKGGLTCGKISAQNHEPKIGCNAFKSLGPTTKEGIFLPDQSSSKAGLCSPNLIGRKPGGVVKAKKSKTYKVNSMSIPIEKVKAVKKLEVGAGALISQKINRDPEKMEYWEEEPAGMIYINYCDVETSSKIVEAGKIEKQSEGFMKDITVG